MAGRQTRMAMTWNGDEFKARARNAVNIAAGKGAVELQNQMKANITLPYPPASKPGESPRRRTGNLRRSVQVALLGDGRARVGTNVKYGRWLEFGVIGKILPRPWAYKAKVMAEAKVKARVRRVFFAELFRAGASAAGLTTTREGRE